MSEGTPRPRRTYSSSQEAASRAHAASGKRRQRAAGAPQATTPDDAKRASTGKGRGAGASQTPAKPGKPTRAAKPRPGRHHTGGPQTGRHQAGEVPARPLAAAGARRDSGAPGDRGAHAAPPRRGRRLGCFGRVLLGLLLLLLLGIAGVVFAYMRTDLPNPNALASSQVSIVYFDDGTTEVGRISGSANRQSVDLKQIPKPVQRAFLAAEDRSFYSNSGVSPSGIGRAIWVALKGGQTQGGSTITQQYVKNYFLTSDQTYKRKVKEIFLSVKLDQEKSKDEILQDYLNTIYFGRGAYGIQTASRAYFDKDVAQLTPGEGAVLAALVKGPSLYDPSLSAANLKRNTDRANWILDAEVQEGWLSQAERRAQHVPQVIPKKPAAITGGTDGYIVAAAKAELMNPKGEAKLTETDFERGGLKIVTTINKAQQEQAVAAVERYWPSQDGYRIGLAAVKPGNGGITAMFGGRDFARQQFNDATQGKVPAASTFKVFTLIAAVEKGLNTKTLVDGNQPYDAPGAKSPINNTEGESSMGTLTLRDALAQSVNTAYARLNVALKPSSTAEVAERLGVPIRADERNIVGNALGQSDATPVQMAGAYAALAAKGVYVAPHIVASAKTEGGHIDYTADTAGKQVIKPDVAADVVEAMQRVVKNGTATDSVLGRGLTRPAAGKTGTGEDSTSAWFDGFVPQLSAAVAMTQQDAKNARQQMSIGGSPVYGGGVPTKIWARFMVRAMAGQPQERFPDRVGVGTIGSIGSDPGVGDVGSVENSGTTDSSDGGSDATGSATDGGGLAGGTPDVQTGSPTNGSSDGGGSPQATP